MQAVKCLVFLAPSLEASLEPGGRQPADGAQARISAASLGAGEEEGTNSEAGEAGEQAAATQDVDGVEGSEDDEEDEENANADRHAEAGVSLAGLIRRMTRAAGNRQYAGAQRRLVALRFVAGGCMPAVVAIRWHVAAALPGLHGICCTECACALSAAQDVL